MWFKKGMMAVDQAETKKRSGAVKKNAPEKKEKSESGLSRYLRETRGEMRKVTWPTREEGQRLTLIVLAVTTAFALFLGLLDFIWSTAVNQLIAFIAGL